jgi:hypothetical protein
MHSTRNFEFCIKNSQTPEFSEEKPRSGRRTTTPCSFVLICFVTGRLSILSSFLLEKMQRSLSHCSMHNWQCLAPPFDLMESRAGSLHRLFLQHTHEICLSLNWPASENHCPDGKICVFLQNSKFQVCSLFCELLSFPKTYNSSKYIITFSYQILFSDAEQRYPIC